MRNKLYFFLVQFICGLSLVVHAKLPPFPVAPAITGATSVCSGATTSLSDPTGGGFWTSDNTLVASVGSGSGIVTGVAAGTTVITYIVSGDTATTVVTVNAVPGAIIGNMLICGSGTTLLTDAVAGGIWSRSNTNVTVNASGIVTGVAPGTSIISYATGCGTVTATVLVNSIPSAGSITGVTNVLVGGSTSLSDATSGAGWVGRAAISVAIGSPAVATLYDNIYVMGGQNSGGCSSGVQVYNATSNTWTTAASMPACIYQGDGAGVINGLIYAPGGWIGAIPTGDMYVYDPVANSWSTGPAMPSLSANGITGVINNKLYVTTYSNGFGGYVAHLYVYDPSTSTWTILPDSPIPHGNPAGGVINGKFYVAGGDDNTGAPNTQLDVYDPVANTWTTLAAMPAAVYGAASGVMNGLLYVTGGLNAANVAQNMTYVYDPVANAWSSLASLPTARGLSPGAVANGALYVFGGYNSGAYLTVNESYTPFTWSSNNTSIATVNDTGFVNGIVGGAATIRYTVGGECTSSATQVVTVLAPINGMNAVCVNATVRLSDVTSGGTWSAGNTNVSVNSSGVVTGISQGTTTITYTVGGGFVTYSLTINANPSSIIGTANLCAFSSATLSDADAGTWSSGATGVATVGAATGVVTGVATGTAVISYTNSFGCSATTIATISSSPSVIHGPSTVCAGAYVTVSNSVAGGFWSSSNTGIATIGSGSGQLTGVVPGTVTISYSVSSGCAANVVVTVNQSPGPIEGATNVCVNSSITLSSAVSGGTWTTTGTGYLSVGSSSGVVTGINTGNTVITYTLGDGCSALSPTTVNPLPLNITGTPAVCVGSLTALTDATTNGQWTSGATSIAEVGSGNGYVVGVSAGSSVISYTIPTGCYRTFNVTVNPLPTAILGADSVCAGATTDLSDLTSGGTWTSGNTLVSTVGAGTGIVTGIKAGTSTITYKLGTGCTTTVSITVNPVPGVINGNTSVCVGATTQLSDTSASGTWVGVGSASINTSGLVTGGSAGTATILYIFLETGCSTLKTVTVDALPAAISGPSYVCTGHAVTLTDATSGGTWSTASTTIASITAYGVLTAGAVPGAVTVTYQLSATGCYYATEISVNETPGAITGSNQVCYGSGTVLSDTTNGGVWSSGTTSVATIGSTGNVASLAVGTSSITYTLAGCSVSDIVTVHPLPAVINGPSAVCVGATITLTETSTGGTWSSGNTGVATISATGIVTGVSAGTVNVSYTFSTGCASYVTISVNPLPTAILGTLSLCPGTTTSLSDNTAGGTWSSGSTLIATVSSGLVSGVQSGTARVSYILSTGCYSSAIATVNPLPDAILGAATVCVSSTSTLSDYSTGGVWTSGNTAVATLSGTSSTVVLNGGSAGTAMITFTLGTGCMTTLDVTVNPLPSAILGVTGICNGATTTLSDLTSAGTWSSGTPAIASIGSASGNVVGLFPGTVTFSYEIATGCKITAPFTVYTVPGAIVGNTYVCQGALVTFTDPLAGGAWSSSNTSVATIGVGSGIVTGITPGTASINYTTAGGCTSTKVLTVNLSPASINGDNYVCVGQGTALSDATPNGVWSSGASAIANIGSASGVATTPAAGVAPITYTLAGGCNAVIDVTVNPLPQLISGILNVCAGATTVLSDATAPGAWSSSNTAGATISATGIVTGVSASVEIITYTLSTGCIRTATFEVYPSPTPISGSTDVCIGATFTLSDGVADGVWSSQATAIAAVNPSTGLVTGEANGNTTVSYRLSNGCFATTTVTIDPTPSPITGATRVCVGSTISMGEAGTGGAWSSDDLSVATVDASGNVSGVSPGTAVISYALASGCFTTTIVTVNAYPGPINGATNVCVASVITLSDASAGTWSSSSPAVAIIDPAGIVTGQSAGTSTITFTPGNGCFVTTTILVNPLPHNINGATSACIGNTIPLSDSSTGGVWSSNNVSLATVGSLTGVVLGVGSGVPEITYTLATGCSIITLVTINSLPAAITGNLAICNGSGVILDDFTTGGVWGSSNTAVAQVGAVSGTVLSESLGTATITYAFATGCIRTAIVTVNPVPAPVTGGGTVCVGSSLVLSDATPGGVWSNASAGIATIGSSSGVVTGSNAGTATLSYTLPAGCRSTTTVAVNPIPTPIAGYKTLCTGNTTPLTDAELTGTWSSTNTLVAVVDLTTGVVSGFSAGTSVISYVLPGSCFVTTVVTVNPSPTPVTGDTIVCVGATNMLSDGVSGGIWSGTHAAIATIGSSTGAVLGVGAGSTTLTYTLPAGCSAVVGILVNPLPAAISGNPAMCVGAYTYFSDAVAGGTWTSSNSALATIGSLSGTILGNEVGSAVITYMLGTGCFKTASVTVNPLPAAITGTQVFCNGGIANLSDASIGGHWTSSDIAVATIGYSTGILTTHTAGTAIITYQFTTGCMANEVITVNPMPAAIIGSTVVCAGTTLFLSDTTAGGAWHSDNTAIATVDGAGNVVTISAGKDTLSYSMPSGCSVETVLTVNPMPVAISGWLNVCTGSSITLTDATSGGVWTSANTAAASIGSATGVVHGITAGTTTVSYKLIAGCYVTSVVTVNQTPFPIKGIREICLTTTNILSDSISGGEWTSGNTSVAPVGLISGITSGVSVGTATITYSLPPGCIATAIVTVEPLPSVGNINGLSHVCLTSTIILSDSIGGGTWVSSAPDTASVNALGEVTGNALGNATITYTVTQYCGVVSTTKNIVVNPLPYSGTVSGIQAVCIGFSLTLSDLTAGGVWSSSNSSIVSVNDSGVITGQSPGVAAISYTVTNICGSVSSMLSVTVDPFAANDTIYTHPSSYICANTGFQNFGVGTPLYAGVRYTWSTVNANLVSESPGNLNTLVSFPDPGIAYVILNVDVLNTGCHNTDTFTAYVSTTESRLDTVSYYTSQFVCSDNTADNYQWGYDDAVTLDSNLILGANFQDYYLASPDFSTRCYWVITTHNGCWQKSYYNPPQKGSITSVKQLSSADVSIILYPNPADSRVNVEVKVTGSANDISAQVFDMMGKNITASLLVDGKGSIDVSALASGVYSVMIVQDGVRLGAATFVRR